MEVVEAWHCSVGGKKDFFKTAVLINSVKTPFMSTDKNKALKTPTNNKAGLPSMKCSE